MNVISQTAAAGCGVLIAGIDAAELEGMCDRVLIMRDGRFAEEIAGEVTVERIVRAVYGAATRTNGHELISGAVD
jgi:ribose transport system ATP-binding protein